MGLGSCLLPFWPDVDVLLVWPLDTSLSCKCSGCLPLVGTPLPLGKGGTLLDGAGKTPLEGGGILPDAPLGEGC